MPEPALTPDAAVERLGQTSERVEAAVLLDGGGVVACTGVGQGAAERLRPLAAELFGAAELAAGRGGWSGASRVEVSRPAGAVFGVRAAGVDGDGLTLLAIAGSGALPSLVFYDMRMTLLAMGARP